METQGGNYNPWDPPPPPPSPPPPLPPSDFHWGGAGGSYPSDGPHFHGPPDHFQGPPAHFNGPPAHFNGPPEQFSHLARKRKFDRPDIDTRIAKLYVGPVPRNVSQQEVCHLFEEFGNVIEVVLLTDKKTGHQQEFCFVKYALVEEAERAIATLHSQFTFPGMAIVYSSLRCKGRTKEQVSTTVPLKIKYAAEKRKRLGLEHIVQQDPSLSRSGPHSLGLVQHDSTFSGPVSAEIVHKVYVNGLNKDASKEEIAEIFSSYGDVADIYIMRDELKRSRGCGFVGFSQRCMAMAAINGLNRTYFMRGCDLPLLVRFADPKKPKKGEFRPTPHLADTQRNNVSDALYLGNSSTCTSLSSKGEQAGTSSCPVANQSCCPLQEMQQTQTAKPFSPSRLSQMSLQESQISQSPIASVDVELLSAMQSSKHGSWALSGIDFSEAFAECDWSEHICPDGDKYYFNCVTSESRWEKPEEFALCEQHIQRLKSQDRSRKEPRTSTLVIPSEGNQVEAAQYQRRPCDFEKPQSTVSCSVEHSHELEPVAPCSAIRY